VRLALLGLAVAIAVAVPWVRRLVRSQPAGGSVAQRLLTAAVVTSALCEAVGLLGFALFLVAGRRLDLYALAALSLLLLSVYFPRLDDWRIWAREMERGQPTV